MNIHDPNVTLPKVTTGSLPASRKVYSKPEAAPDLRVPIREISLDASSGEPPLPVYDTTGPYTDPAVDDRRGEGAAAHAHRMGEGARRVEEYEGRPIQPVDNGNVTGKHLARNFPNTPKPWRAVSFTSPWRGRSAGAASREGGAEDHPTRRFAPTLPLQGRDSTPSPNTNGRGGSSPRK